MVTTESLPPPTGTSGVLAASQPSSPTVSGGRRGLRTRDMGASAPGRSLR